MLLFFKTMLSRYNYKTNMIILLSWVVITALTHAHIRIQCTHILHTHITHTHGHTHMHTYAYNPRTHTGKHTHTHAYIYIYIYIYIYSTHLYRHIYTYTHAHSHTCLVWFIFIQFLGLISYQFSEDISWYIKCQSHSCRKTIVVLFNTWLREKLIHDFSKFKRKLNRVTV